ncbi:MAG: glycosyltransferase [Eubacteriaceae bacterium]
MAEFKKLHLSKDNKILSQEISNPKKLSKKPLVSVCIITYNHVKYISKAIDGALMQITNFDYEILIGEDASIDGTRNICIEYALKYPDKIRLFLNNRDNVIYVNNRATGRWNLLNLLKNSKGTYVAICEGDDYWTDPEKLVLQVKYLDSQRDCSICFHNVLQIYQNNKIIPKPFCYKSQKKISNLLDLIKRGNFIPTCSVLFRNNIINEFPDWFNKTVVGDFPLHVLNAEYGDIGYINKIMGVKRSHIGGVWYSRNDIEKLMGFIEIYQFLNKHFKNKYNHIINEKISDYYYRLAVLYKNNSKKNPEKLRTRRATIIGMPISKIFTKLYFVSIVSYVSPKIFINLYKKLVNRY